MINISEELLTAIHNNIKAAKKRNFNAVSLRDNYQANLDHQQLHEVYLLSRMPATYAAISQVFKEFPQGCQIESVLDIGAGPGTGLWAVRERFPTLKAYTGLEADETFIRMAQCLNGSIVEPEKVQWLKGKYPSNLPDIRADLVLLSYTLGENSSEILTTTIDHLWRCNVSEWLVIIEPGTPKGFQNILKARELLIKTGGYIYAPCKGNYLCPLSFKDWCHFSIRLKRTQVQKQIKNATLPYEDEKFSYLIVRKTESAVKSDEARIIKKPIVRSGHITLDLCSKDPYERITISKSQKAEYQQAKKLEWGDSWVKGKKND